MNTPLQPAIRVENPETNHLRGFEEAQNHDCEEAGCVRPFKYGTRLEDLLRYYREWRRSPLGPH